MDDITLKPDAIYEQINNELDKVVRSINELPRDAAVDEAKKNAQRTLRQYQEDLQQQLHELQKNAEWNRFTIAFYGETGVGKSTLIETLRILLNEPDKANQRAQFEKTRVQMHDSARRITELDADIQTAQGLIAPFAEQVQATRESFAPAIQAAQQDIDTFNLRHQEALGRSQALLATTQDALNQANQAVQRLESHLENHNKTASWWAKFKTLFVDLPEKSELIKAKLVQQEAAASHATASAHAQAEQEKLHQARTELEQVLIQTQNACEQACMQVVQGEQHTAQRLALLQSEQQQLIQQHTQLLEQMAQLADGEIIGTGSSDTTKIMQQYNFSLAGQDFALLDVPGIEGNEATVQAQIELALQKAHAVFYMTNKPSAPQKGDDTVRGTLEKIKVHLGAQTEVWSVYNKKITSPKHSLKHTPLLTESELKTIHAIDASGLNFAMREQLGHHYRDAVTLAALPAFLASTDHFLPDSQNAKRRDKAMEDFTPEELLQRSGLNDFIELLSGSLVVDAKARLQRANINKAYKELNTTHAKLQALRANFSALSLNLWQQEEDAKSQLQSSFNSIRVRLKAAGNSLIQEFESTVRERVYHSIDTNLSKDQFKSALELHLTSQQEKLQKKLPRVMGNEIERFKNDVQSVTERFAEQANELTAIYTQLNKTQLHSNIDITINMNSGIKIGSLLLTLGGAVAAVLGTGGWVLVIGVTGLVYSFAKSVWGYIDSDFKKSEQRKSTNENLNKIVSQLETSLEDGLKKAIPELQHRLQLIEKELEAPARETKSLVRILDHTNERLSLASKQIMSQGGLS